MQTINRSDRPLANDHLEGPASCKWSSEGTRLLQMIIQRDRPLANDHPEGPAICKWSSGGAGLLQMIVWRDCLCRSLCSPQNSNKRFALITWSFVAFLLRIMFFYCFLSVCMAGGSNRVTWANASEMLYVINHCLQKFVWGGASVSFAKEFKKSFYPFIQIYWSHHNFCPFQQQFFLLRKY